jgi:hypothetical protein
MNIYLLIKTNDPHDWRYQRSVRETQEKLKLSSDGGDFNSKEFKRGYGSACGGV